MHHTTYCVSINDTHLPSYWFLHVFGILQMDVWEPLPSLVLGGAAIVGGLLTLMLPETFKSKMPDTIDDVENLRK